MRKLTMGVASLLLLGLASCSAADVASRNLSNDADNFKILRRIVFVNGITDNYLLEIEGYCSLREDRSGGSSQLEVTCKVGDNSFKKHFLGLSDNVTYVSEQVEGANVSTDHYKIRFRPQTIVPEIVGEQ